MSSGNKKPIKVRAKHAYQRQNEDELTFLKGDIITVMKKEDGGWWEGTLNGNSGWFPSNFVREIRTTKKIEADALPTKAALQDQVETKTQETKITYYQQVLQNLLETEKNYVKELQNLVGDYIKPLQPQTAPGGDGIPASDIEVLSGNIQAIIDFQVKFVKELEECFKLTYPQQNPGHIFLKNNETFRKMYEEYCSNHPSAVSVIQTHKDQISRQLESKNGPTTGLTQLTAGLSKPFRHLEEYSSLLRELERHLEDSHTDRMNVLQSISQYERISLVCQETRKRKETIQHILSSPIQGLESDSISSYGPVLYMSSVTFLSGPDEKKQRYLLLFPSCLIILSVSPRMSGFRYEGMLPLTPLQAKRLDDTATYQHAFELTGNLIDSKIVITRSTEEQRRWLQVLQSQCGQCRPQVGSHPSPIITRAPVTQIPQTPKPVPGHIMPRPSRTTPELHSPPTVASPPFHISKTGMKTEKNHRILSLRPAAPLRHLSSNRESQKSPKTTRRRREKTKGKQSDRKTVDEEANSIFDQRGAESGAWIPDEQEVLEVLKHYCNAVHTRSTTHFPHGNKTKHTSILEEKIIVEDHENGGLEEKSLVDTVYDLKDQVSELLKRQKKFTERLEEETRSRKKLENIIKREIDGALEMKNVALSFTEIAAKATTDTSKLGPGSSSLRRTSSSSAKYDGGK